MPSTDLNQFTDQADKIGRFYTQTLREIRADGSLSDEGKRAQIEEAYNTAKAQMDQLRATTDGDRQTRITTLQRTLFGTVGTNSTDAISFRDATDRALAIKDEDEAEAMMDSAVVSSDKILQGAILKRAYDELKSTGRPWMKAINAYERAHPTDAGKLQELLDILGRPDITFGRALSSAIIRPVELGGWG